MVGCFLLETPHHPLQKMASCSVSNRQHASQLDCLSPPGYLWHVDSSGTSFLNYCLDNTVPPLGSNYYLRIGLFQTFPPVRRWAVSQIYNDLSQKFCSHRNIIFKKQHLHFTAGYLSGQDALLIMTFTNSLENLHKICMFICIITRRSILDKFVLSGKTDNK